MKKSTNTSEIFPITPFAVIDQSKVSELGKLKASGCACAVYIAILMHSQNNNSSFPSIHVISEAIGGKYTTTAIEKSLQWLEDNEIIAKREK